MKQLDILITEPEDGYALLDSGRGYKTEKFGKFVLSRPDPQALWQGDSAVASDAVFNRDGEKGKWSFNNKVPEKWELDFAGLKFWIKPTPFKHVGLFPEQSPNWKWMEEKIGNRKKVTAKSGGEINVLNLFAYTGGASLVCAKAGARVTHIDSSKSAVTWAKENAELSGLGDKPIRWIVEDARIFVEREIRRGNKYDGIIMDPPAFGHGPDSELWKIEEDFLNLIANCMELLSENPIFFLINGYSAGYSSIAYKNNLRRLEEKYGGKIEGGELAIRAANNGNLLPAGIYARWSK